jgi:hypothetical protein
MSDNEGIAFRFQAYTGDGLPVSVTVGAQDFDTFNQYLRSLEAGFPQLGSFRMLLREPPSGALRPKEYRITGWMRGQTTDNKTGEFLPAVYLYSDLAHLDYSVCTVYQEMLPGLPPNINWESAPLVGNAAPPTAQARGMKSYNACDMTVVMMPQFDHEGNPQVTKGGQPKYKFSHVVGYTAPGDGQGAPAAPAPSAPAPSQAPAPAPSQAPSQAPAGDAGHRKPPTRPVQQAGAAPGAIRLNTDSKSCPQCRAPSGKRHGDGCTVGLETPKDTPLPENPFDGDEKDALAPYAKGFSNDSVQLTPDTVALILEMRQLDKSSGRSMTITVPAKDGQPAVPGQYNFLVGLIKKLAEKLGATDEEIHNKVLSFIFGSAVRSNTAPGENAKVLIDRLHPGTVKNGPNPKFHQGTANSIMEIIGAIMFMDTLLEDEEIEYAA